MERTDCRKCKFYKMTWETKHPHTCRLLEFKSKQLPSVVAFKATGAACVGFEPKPRYIKQTEPDNGHVVVDIKRDGR